MKAQSYWIILATLLSLLFVAANGAVAEAQDRNPRDFTGGTGWGSTREEILQNRERRKRQLRNLMNAMRKKLADHSAGEITLEAQEKADMERRLDLYSRKLTMLQADLEEKVNAEGTIILFRRLFNQK